MTTNVVTGKADVFYADSPVAGYAISQTDDQLEALGEDVGVTKEAVAIKKGDSDTAKAVQAAMQKLMDDGTYMKILKHWGRRIRRRRQGRDQPDRFGLIGALTLRA